MLGYFERYFLKQIITLFLAISFILILILSGGVLTKLLGKVAQGAIPISTLVPLFFLTCLRSFDLIVSIALFLATMLALGKMYSDSEITAFKAAGNGEFALFRPVLIFGALMAIIIFGLNAFVVPWAYLQTDLVLNQAKSNVNIAGITPGQFMVMSDSNQVIFAESQEDNQLKNIFIYEKLASEIQVITSETASQIKDEETESSVLALENGESVRIKADNQGYTKIQFKRNGIRLLEEIVGDSGLRSLKASYLHDLWTTRDKASSQVEIYWRLSAPITLIVLLIIAVPLSEIRPRQGAYSKLIFGILLYIVYLNFEGLIKNWSLKGTLPSYGLLFVHFFFLGLAVMLIYRHKLFNR